ncbi:MAG: hypothetical protein DMG75_00755 [Acidobacteria bacterium]|nr:MAG: hypothetical protein DMG75_00755 [Acidobacteriota bacterium]
MKERGKETFNFSEETAMRGLRGRWWQHQRLELGVTTSRSDRQTLYLASGRRRSVDTVASPKDQRRVHLDMNIVGSRCRQRRRLRANY